MKIQHIIVTIFILLVGFVTSCSSDSEVPIDSQDDMEVTDDGSGTSGDDDGALPAETRENVSYGSNPEQVYDVYLPQGRTEEKTKVIILVHGGGWTEGDKADMTQFVSLIQENLPDHAIVNMNYVLAGLPNTPAFPNQFLDIDRVINQLTDQAAELDIKPEFALLGASAGAHLSLMYDSVYDEDDVVKMVGDIVGPSDFTDPFYANNSNFQLILQLLVDEEAYPAGTNYAEAVSPVFQVNSANSPTLMFYGNMDPLVPLTNGENLAIALQNAGVDHRFTVYQGGHGEDWSEADRLDLQNQFVDYIETYLPIEN